MAIRSQAFCARERFIVEVDVDSCTSITQKADASIIENGKLVTPAKRTYLPGADFFGSVIDATPKR
jgi:hypothetical protein